MANQLTQKIHILLFLCIFGVCTGYAGNGGLLKDALNRGPLPNGMYCITNPKGKNIDVENLRVYLVRHGYAAANADYASNGRLKSLLFVNRDDYAAYYHYCLSPSPTNIHQAKNVGKASVLYLKKEKIWDKDNWRYIYSPYFTQPQKALWTGDVVDGYVHGKGSGVIMISNELCAYFEGEYNYGFPISQSIPINSKIL